MSLYSSLTQVLAPFAAKIKGIQTGYDGTEYSSPGEAVREQINDLHVLIGDEPGTAINASAIGYGEDSNVADELDGLNGRLDELNTILDYTDTMERADNPKGWEVGYVRENGTIGSSSQRIVNRTMYAGNGKSYTITMDTGWALEKVCEYRTTALGSFVEMIFHNEGAESVTVTLKAEKFYIFQIRKDPVQTVESTDDMTDDTISIAYHVKSIAIDGMNENITELNEDMASTRAGLEDVKKALNIKTEYSPVAFSAEIGGYTSNMGEEITFDALSGWKKTSFVPEIGSNYKITFYNTSGNSSNLNYVCEVDSNNIVLAVHGTIDKSQSVQQNEIIITPLAETAVIWIKGKNGAAWPFTIDKVVISTDVDEVKESVAVFGDTIAELSSTYDKKISIDGKWAQGAIESTGGTESNSTVRIRTGYISNDGLVYKVDVPSEYKVGAFLFESKTTTSFVGCWDGTTPVKGTITWLQDIRLDAISYPFVRLVISKTNGDTIDVDEANVCSFYAKRNIINAHGNLNSGMISLSTIDNATGMQISNSQYSTTEFIKLPNWEINQRYNPYTKLYIKSYDGTSYDTHFTKAVFYRSDKTVLSIITSDDEMDIPNDAAYVRVVFPKSNSYPYVGCGILTDAPTYQPYHETVSDDYIPSIVDTICNSDGAKTNLVKTALQYLGNTDFGYGNTHTAYSASAEAVESDGVTSANGSQSDTKCYDGVKFQIDCSGFTRLVMQCIYPEYTRHYGKSSNIVPPWGYRYDENAEYDTPQGRLTAHKQALYAYKRGFIYPLKNDYSNAEVGDMIFVANSSAMWGSIGHARIITNVTPLKNGGKQVTIMEVNSTFPPVHASRSTERAYNQYYAARFPLPYAAGGMDIIGTAEPSTVQTSSADGVITEISLSETTQGKEIYTIVFKANFGNSDNYAVVTGLGNNISFENVLVYNGLHVYTVVLPVDGSAGSNTVVIKAHEADTVTFGGAKIYKGFHTPTMSEFN